jgi:hypothetical protein
MWHRLLQESADSGLNLLYAPCTLETMSSFPDPDSHRQTLESCVRGALTRGELPPAAEAQIAQLAASNDLSSGDRRLLALLNDAIQNGYVRRVQPSPVEEVSEMRAKTYSNPPVDVG